MGNGEPANIKLFVNRFQTGVAQPKLRLRLLGKVCSKYQNHTCWKEVCSGIK